MENFTLTPIFALHSQNGIGLPDGVTVAQLFLVQFVLVRIQVRQPKEKPQRKLGLFSFKSDPKEPSEASTIRRKGKCEHRAKRYNGAKSQNQACLNFEL